MNTRAGHVRIAAVEKPGQFLKNVLSTIQIEETLETILSRYSSQPFSPDEIRQLSNLIYIDGKKKIPPDDEHLIFELMGMRQSISFEELYNHLQEARSREDIILEAPTMNKAHVKYRRDMEISLYKPVVTVGASKCPKCRSEQVLNFEMQTRGADESVTIFNRCIACDYRWRS